MVSQKQVYTIIKRLVGSNDVIAVNVSLVRFTGSWPAGVLLSQLLYWSDKTRITGGWVCKTHSEWNDELMLTKDQIRSTVKKLENMGIIETEFKKFNGTPKPHYRIKEAEFTEKFVAFSEGREIRGSGNPTVEKPAGQGSENPTVEGSETQLSRVDNPDCPITDTTTDTTTEIKTDNKTTPEGDGVLNPIKNKWEGTGQLEPDMLIHLESKEKKEEEKDSAQKEEESEPVSQRKLKDLYQDAWWEFYKEQKNGKEPPFSWQNYYTMGGPLKEIQQDLAAEFDGDEEKAYQEFVSILSGWQHPKNYHRHRIRPKQIHNHLEEIRGILREERQKSQKDSNKVPILGEALEIFREAHLQHRELPPNIDEARDLPLLGKTLEYLKSTKPDGTWPEALKAFEFICQGWPVLEGQDKFYEQHFNIRFIHGNTDRIIQAFKAKRKQQPDLSPAAAAAYLARIGAHQQR